jgi:hypothetical protein
MASRPTSSTSPDATPASSTRGERRLDRIEHFRQFGGIRIEDDVVCTAGAPENLTRDAFALA